MVKPNQPGKVEGALDMMDKFLQGDPIMTADDMRHKLEEERNLKSYNGDCDDEKEC